MSAARTAAAAAAVVYNDFKIASFQRHLYIVNIFCYPQVIGSESCMIWMAAYVGLKTVLDVIM